MVFSLCCCRRDEPRKVQVRGSGGYRRTARRGCTHGKSLFLGPWDGQRSQWDLRQRENTGIEEESAGVKSNKNIIFACGVVTIFPLASGLELKLADLLPLTSHYVSNNFFAPLQLKQQVEGHSRYCDASAIRKLNRDLASTSQRLLPVHPPRLRWLLLIWVI